MATNRDDRNARIEGRANAQSGRSRAARFPNYQMAAIIPLWLFSPDDVRRLSADAAGRDHALKVQPASDLELTRIAQNLHYAFEWAVRSDHMQKWQAEPQRVRRAYKQVTLRADSLLKALDLVPEECRNPTKEWRPWSAPPAIHGFRQSLDRMAGARADLPDQLDALSRVAWDERSSKVEGDGLDPDGYCQYRARASFLIDRLPRVLALLGAMAEWEAQKLMQPPKSARDQSDQFSQQLFKILAREHESIFACKPVTRAKTGNPIGGSIDWARAVIRHAANAIESSPQPAPLPISADSTASADHTASALAQSR